MRATILLAALALLGCVPTDFEELRSEASTIALAPPGDYPNRGFGEVLTTYTGTRSGQFGSRIGASAGFDTPFGVYPLLIGDEVRLDSPTLHGCAEEGRCMAGAGVSLAGMPRWADRELCIASPSPEGEIQIRCEDDPTRIEIANGPGGQRFGETAVGLPEHPFARALFGAPGSFGGRGSVYRLPDRAPPVELDLSEGFGGGGELGSALAARVVDADTVLIAASAPVGPVKRVVVARGDVLADGSIVTRVHGCIDATTPGWGMALAIGDLNGDGALDVAVGSGQEPGRLEAVRVYDGAAMPPGGTCDASAWPVAVELSCPDLEGIDCTAGSFGASLAVGDVDGDGVGDLIVGAPLAEVDGEGGAGAAFVYRGVPALTDLDTTVVALTSSSPSAGAGLGTTVAAAPGAVANETSGARRDEPVAGAPGVDRVYVFLCSGLDGDSPETTGSSRCQP